MEAMTDTNIRLAVHGWCKSQATRNNELKRIVILRHGHISDWDTSMVTNMKDLFFKQSDFNDNISRWDVSKVQNMSRMFQDACHFNQPLNDWQVRNVQWMYAMFQSSAFDQPLDQWDVRNVIDVSKMFYDVWYNHPLDQWKLESVRYWSHMLYEDSDREYLYVERPWVIGAWKKYEISSCPLYRLFDEDVFHHGDSDEKF
jgi:surface protein